MRAAAVFASPSGASRSHELGEDNMYRKATMALAVAAALGLPHAATAQTQDELRTLREQVRQLDRRVMDAEQAAIQASSRPASESAMNPAVSVILNGIYSNLSQDPNAFRING